MLIFRGTFNPDQDCIVDQSGTSLVMSMQCTTLGMSVKVNCHNPVGNPHGMLLIQLSLGYVPREGNMDKCVFISAWDDN